MIIAAVAIVLLAALAAATNCIVTARTCPPPGTLREMLEDALTAAIGFVGGRYSADRK